MTKLLLELKVNTKKNFKRNFTSPVIFALILFIAGMYLVKYMLQYEFNSEMRKTIAYSDWGLAAGTFLVLMLSVNTKGVTTYGIYLAVAKVLSILFWVLGSDLHKITGGAIQFTNGFGAGGSTTLHDLFKSISNVMVVGTLIVEVLILPSIWTVALGNALNFFVISNLTSSKQKTAWSIIFTLFEIALFFAIFQFVIYPFFNTMADHVIGNELAGAGKLAQFLKPVLAFVFFPLLFMINNMSDSNLFLGRNQQLYMATQITFLLKYIALHNTMMGLNQGIIIFPIIMIGFIGVKMLAFLFLLFKTARFNNKGWKGDVDGEFFPIIIAWKQHENKFFRHMSGLSKETKVHIKPKSVAK